MEDTFSADMEKPIAPALRIKNAMQSADDKMFRGYDPEGAHRDTAHPEQAQMVAAVGCLASGLCVMWG